MAPLTIKEAIEKIISFGEGSFVVYFRRRSDSRTNRHERAGSIRRMLCKIPEDKRVFLDFATIERQYRDRDYKLLTVLDLEAGDEAYKSLPLDSIVKICSEKEDGEQTEYSA